MVVFPNAKINIGLKLVRKRPDGYHDLETVFYPVRINDGLEVIESDELRFTTSGIEIPGGSENNLVLAGYNLLSRYYQLPPVHIHLHKNIPIGAGLGGGSADAAFFIRLMNEKFSLGMSTREMERYSSLLGADCPFFIRNRPVFAHGRGDQFEPVEVDLSAYFLVLIMPSIHVSTADAFKGAKPDAIPGRLQSEIQKPLPGWNNAIVNDFEKQVFDLHPQIREIKEFLYSQGAVYASMSGTGAAVYGLFQTPVTLPDLELNNRVFYDV